MCYVSLNQILKNTISCPANAVLIASCNGDRQSVTDEMPRLYPVPLRVLLNTHEGYSINQLTGDSIQSILNESGETFTHFSENGVLSKILVYSVLEDNQWNRQEHMILCSVHKKLLKVQTLES